MNQPFAVSACHPIVARGIAVKMLLPGDVEMLLYEPRHNTVI
jgi:hypothetical protein